MPDAQWAGLLAVLAGGIFQGSFMLPMKWASRWHWENTWLVFASTGYLLAPWLVVFLTIPHALEIYGALRPGTLFALLLFGVGWGIGALTFGLGINTLGMALGFAIILGLTACAGAVIPILFLSLRDFSFFRILWTGLSLALMLAGVIVCSFAGRWKERDAEPAGLSYRKGLAICVASGILSSCGNLGFVYGGELIHQAVVQGVPAYLAPNLVWALLTGALFICNAGYSTYLLFRNGSFADFARPGTGRCFLFGSLMGALWMGGFVFYGMGARQLGRLGPSLGWAILMSTNVLIATFWGIATGEWRDSPLQSRWRLGQGVMLLFLAIIGLGIANNVR